MSAPGLRLAVSAALVACSGPESTPRRGADGDVPLVVALAPGSVLLIAPARVAGEPAADARVVDGLFREALRQSDSFDVATRLDAPGRGHAPLTTVQVTVDAVARTLAATLVPVDGPPQPLAGAEFATAKLPAAIDVLAVRVRRALGEAEPAPPLPVAVCYSADPQAIAFAEAALAALHTGDFATALAELRRARARDGGSPFVLDWLAAVLSLRGDVAGAERCAREALGYEQRLADATRHRLARTLLLAQGSLQPDRTAALDRDLLALAAAYQRERPHDPQGRLTEAIARNFRGEFAETAAILGPLQSRLPDNPSLLYHLGYAELALGHGAAASAAFERAAPMLPPASTIVPCAIARYEAGDHDGLRRFLAGLTEDAQIAASPARHELLRMQAAHALLQRDTAAAASFLKADLAFLQQQPSLLAQRAGEFAEQGEVIVRLGHGSMLPPALAALQAQNPEPIVGAAIAFLQGLGEVAAGDAHADRIGAALATGGQEAWAAVLEAFRHRRRGELADEHAALARAAARSESVLVKAALVRCLADTGRQAEADALQNALRRELRHIGLRQRCRHPLLGPELAMAWLGVPK